MSKGLGAILAHNKMLEDMERIEKGDGIACPLCGQIMSFNGCAWFCYADRCTPFRDQLFEAFKKETKGFGAYDNFQGLILAAIISTTDNAHSTIVAEFRTVRGGGGKTNFAVMASLFGPPKEMVPGIIRNGEWNWQEWVPDFY